MNGGSQPARWFKWVHRKWIENWIVFSLADINVRHEKNKTIDSRQHLICTPIERNRSRTKANTQIDSFCDLFFIHFPLIDISLTGRFVQWPSLPHYDASVSLPTRTFRWRFLFELILRSRYNRRPTRKIAWKLEIIGPSFRLCSYLMWQKICLLRVRMSAEGRCEINLRTKWICCQRFPPPAAESN